MEKIFELSYKLHDYLINTNEYKNLKKIENIMLNDKKSKDLIDKYHEMLIIYNDNKNEENLKKLHEIKYKMDMDTNVILYKKAYKDYQIVISNITDLVFKDLKDESIFDKFTKI